MIPIPDIDRTSYFLVFGANPMASNGSLMTVPDFPNRAARAEAGAAARWWSSTRAGPRPPRSPTSTTSCGRPRDAMVLLAMVHVLFAEGLTTPPAYVDGIESVRLAVADFTPELAERGLRGARRDDPPDHP